MVVANQRRNWLIMLVCRKWLSILYRILCISQRVYRLGGGGWMVSNHIKTFLPHLLKDQRVLFTEKFIWMLSKSTRIVYKITPESWTPSQGPIRTTYSSCPWRSAVEGIHCGCCSAHRVVLVFTNARCIPTHTRCTFLTVNVACFSTADFIPLSPFVCALVFVHVHVGTIITLLWMCCDRR